MRIPRLSAKLTTNTTDTCSAAGKATRSSIVLRRREPSTPHDSGSAFASDNGLEFVRSVSLYVSLFVMAALKRTSVGYHAVSYIRVLGFCAI